MEQKSRVLVIDDDITLLKSVAELLLDTYAVSLAESGDTALRLLDRCILPDIILLDVDMPHIDGYSLMARLAQREQTASIPVMFLTGLTTPQDEVRGLELGAVDYIKKPIIKEVLLTRLKIQLDMSRRLSTKTVLDETLLAALPHPLTKRELEVARLLARFFTNEEICLELHYSLPYIKKLVSSVLAKLEIKSRNEIRLYIR